MLGHQVHHQRPLLMAKSPKVARIRLAEETGSRSCPLHQTGEEFLNSTVASEEPVAPTTGRDGGTDGVCKAYAAESFGEAAGSALTTTSWCAAVWAVVALTVCQASGRVFYPHFFLRSCVCVSAWLSF